MALLQRETNIIHKTSVQNKRKFCVYLFFLSELVENARACIHKKKRERNFTEIHNRKNKLEMCKINNFAENCIF